MAFGDISEDDWLFSHMRRSCFLIHVIEKRNSDLSFSHSEMAWLFVARKRAELFPHELVSKHLLPQRTWQSHGALLLARVSSALLDGNQGQSGSSVPREPQLPPAEPGSRTSLSPTGERGTPWHPSVIPELRVTSSSSRGRSRPALCPKPGPFPPLLRSGARSPSEPGQRCLWFTALSAALCSYQPASQAPVWFIGRS